MLYEAEIIKPSKFSIPLISVGNLSIGGAGKTPHIEYLIRLLQPYIDTATLSRGYNRKSQGFRFVTSDDTALLSGDEPLMYARKFPGLPVAVCENRAIGIPQMIQKHTSIQTILLDDAFQHRSVSPFINILLTQHENPFVDDYLLPAGRLREWRNAYKRADLIVVSKCPDDLSQEEGQQLIKRLDPLKHQQVFFTKYIYGQIYHFYNSWYKMDIDHSHHVFLISAIANTAYLLRHIKQVAGSFVSKQFEDHHNFTIDDIENIIDDFKSDQHAIKYVLTTEKDAVRLLPFKEKLYQQQIPIFVLPVEVRFLFDGKEKFDTHIKEKLMKFER